MNFLMIDRMDILLGLHKFAFRVPNHVTAEIEEDEQKNRLRTALENGTVEEIEIADLAETALYGELRAFLGDGESACVAIGATRRWVVAADEKGRLRREIQQRLANEYLLDTPGALVEALRAQILTIQEAEAIRVLLAQNRFAMKGVPPFEQLLAEE